MHVERDLEASDIFECQQCGDCCTGYGGTYVSPEDIESIAKFKGISAERIIKDCCSMSGDRRVLSTGNDGKCIFFDKLCTIHPVKPHMCRAWPFIKNILTNPENWNAMANSCPGIKKDIPHDTLIRIVKEEREKIAPQNTN